MQQVGRRLALQLANVWTPAAAMSLAPGREWSGPVVASTVVTIEDSTKLPVVEVTFGHAGDLALLPAQGCFHCCNQTAPPPKGQAGAGEWLFEVANHQGEWLHARAAVVEVRWQQRHDCWDRFPAPLCHPPQQTYAWTRMDTHAPCDVIYLASTLTGCRLLLATRWCAPIHVY